MNFLVYSEWDETWVLMHGNTTNFLDADNPANVNEAIQEAIRQAPCSDIFVVTQKVQGE